MSNEAAASVEASPIEAKLQMIEATAAEVKNEAEEKSASVKGMLIDLTATNSRQGETLSGNQATILSTSEKQHATLMASLKLQLDLLHREMEQNARDNAPAGRRFKEFEKTDGEFDYSKPVFEWSAVDVTVGVASTIVTVAVIVAAGYAGGRAARPADSDAAPMLDDGGEF